MLTHALLTLLLPRNYLELVERIPFNREVLACTTEIGASRSILHDIATYRKPVLIVNGSYDLFFRLDEKRFLHRLPRARLRLMRGTDHTGPLRRSGEFASIVEAFAAMVFHA